MSKHRCINIDWLEVYALEDTARFPCDADYFRAQGYQVRERDYGTRVYREMFTILDWHDEPFIEVRRNPASTIALNGGLFPPESCHLRLSNRACYSPTAINDLREFMVRHNYTLGHIFRLDICLDFETFDRGDDPAKFIARYMSGKFSKVNQANITAHGTDRWEGRVWNSLSWGSPKSMVGTKIYCKTLELKQVKDKPYIKFAWFEQGLIDDPINMTKRDQAGKLYTPNIWRVEFSIKSSAKRYLAIKRADGKHNKIEIPHTLSTYDTPLKLEIIFASLAQHYFRFKHFEYKDTSPNRGLSKQALLANVLDDGHKLVRGRFELQPQRKDRCKDKVLFDFSANDTFYKIDRLASHTAKTKPRQRLINLLHNYDLITTEPEVHKAIAVLVDYIERDILRDMNEQGTLTTEILALQRLIADRTRGIKDKSAAKQLEELETYLANNHELF